MGFTVAAAVIDRGGVLLGPAYDQSRGPAMRRAAVLRLAVASRVIMVGLCALFDVVIPDHDAGGVFRLPAEPDRPSNGSSLAPRLVELCCSFGAKWDGERCS